MGRRPNVKSASMSGLDPEVQQKVNAIANLVLEEALARLTDKKVAGAFKNLTLKELMAEIRGLVRAITPTTSLQQINIPLLPQQAPADGKRHIELERSADSPEKLRRLRESQQAFLSSDEQTPE